MALRHGEIARLGEARRQLAAQKMEERRDALDQLREILHLETLDADWLAGARNLFARKARERFDVAQHVAARQIRGRRVRGGRLNYFDDAAVNDEKRVAGIARGVN